VPRAGLEPARRCNLQGILSPLSLFTSNQISPRVPNPYQEIVNSVGKTVSEVKPRTFVKPGIYRGNLVPEEGVEPTLSVR